MKKISFYRWLVLIAALLWLAETAFFGWNNKPESSAEKFADTVVLIGLFWGIIGDITHNLTINKYETHNINTDTVEIYSTNPKFNVPAPQQLPKDKD